MAFRQKFSRFVLCFALSISVFFCTQSVAFADETETTSATDTVYESGDVLGEISLQGSGQEYDLSTLAELGEYDYVGSTSIHTQTSYAHIIFSNYSGTALLPTAAYASFELPVPVLFRMNVERGHTYSGQIYFMLHVEMPRYATNNGTDYYRQVSLGDFEQVSNYDGVSVSYYGFTNFPDKSSSGSCDVTVCVTFDNYQPTFTGTLNVNSFFHLYGYFQLYDELLEGNVYFPKPVMTCTVSTDWAGELYDYPTDAIVDSEGSLIKNQTIQQQQIANQQSLQSAQQHEDLKNGFQDDTYNSNVSNAGNTVDSYISVESDLMNSQNQIMSNYTDTAFNTGTLAPFTNAIAMCSTWYTWIWNSFSELNVAFVVVLAVGVACLIVGIKKRG